MRRTKTDAVDCFLVAEYARFKRVGPSERDPEDEEGLKQLTRYRPWLVRERTALKNKVGDLVGRLFPELPRVFGTLLRTSGTTTTRWWAITGSTTPSRCRAWRESSPASASRS